MISKAHEAGTANAKDSKPGGRSRLRLRNLKYYLSEVFKSLYRNKVMSLTSTVTVCACMIIFISFYAMAANIQYILNYLEGSVGITAIVDDSLLVEDVSRLHTSIVSLDNVASVKYISADDALYSLAASLGDDTGEFILSLSEYNPLRRSFTITMEDIRVQDNTITALNALPGIVNINDASLLTNALISLNNFVSVVALLVIAVLAVLSVVIIMNTIKLTVNNRRSEIHIMKYVGATEWFIKWPFVIEGVIIGLLGAAIPLGIAWFIYDRIVYNISNFPVIGEPLPFMAGYTILPVMSVIVLLLGAVIGTLGSITSMRKYLSV